MSVFAVIGIITGPPGIPDTLDAAVGRGARVILVRIHGIVQDHFLESRRVYRMARVDTYKGIIVLQGVVDHIDQIVDLVGPDHVGLGSDFDGIPYTPVGLEDATRMPNITAELVKREYDEEDIKKILGGNHLRLIKQVVG